MNKANLRREKVRSIALYWGELGDGHDGWMVRVVNMRRGDANGEPWELDILEQHVLNPGGEWIGDYHAEELRLPARYADGSLHRPLAQARYEKLGEAQKVLDKMAEILEARHAEGRKVGDWGIREILREAENAWRDEERAAWEAEMAPWMERWNDPEQVEIRRRNHEALVRIQAQRKERARVEKNRKARERRAAAKKEV